MFIAKVGSLCLCLLCCPVLLNFLSSKSHGAFSRGQPQPTKIMASGPITSWEIDGETVETVSDFIFGGAPKSLQMMTAAMKLKDAYS